MDDQIPKSTRRALAEAEWIASRHIDKRRGADIVRDALEAVRSDLLAVLGSAGAAHPLDVEAEDLERDGD
jgi:hypothetical protein